MSEEVAGCGRGFPRGLSHRRIIYGANRWVQGCPVTLLRTSRLSCYFCFKAEKTKAFSACAMRGQWNEARHSRAQAAVGSVFLPRQGPAQERPCVASSQVVGRRVAMEKSPLRDNLNPDIS